jgi:uncharacterized protein YndB with AHSA1/START domain
MITTAKTTVTVETSINAPVERVWSLWTDPKHIRQWNQASEDWYTPRAENNLKPGGTFSYRMEARDGSSGFDYSGKYDSIILMKQIKFTLDDGRSVHVAFTRNDDQTVITESFEPDREYSLEMQKVGWQAILNHFKKYVEKSAHIEVLHFEITINANAQQVYNTMTDSDHYRAWTSVFNPASRYEGTWEKDSQMLFIGETDGKKNSLIGKIQENIPNRFISIEYLGMVTNGEDQFSGPDIDPWIAAQEKYTYHDLDGKTRLEVDVDCVTGFISFFSKTWPEALQKLKSLCEVNS